MRSSKTAFEAEIKSFQIRLLHKLLWGILQFRSQSLIATEIWSWTAKLFYAQSFASSQTIMRESFIPWSATHGSEIKDTHFMRLTGIIIIILTGISIISINYYYSWGGCSKNCEERFINYSRDIRSKSKGHRNWQLAVICARQARKCATAVA